MNIVAHNLLAMNSNRMLGITENKRSKSTEKLSSGYKINRAADDAAGLAISEKMRKQIRGLNRAAANIQDGISYVQVAEGALGEIHDMLHRLTELSMQSANGTNSDTDRMYLDQEVQQIKSEMDRIFTTTSFNEKLIWQGGVLSSWDEQYTVIEPAVTFNGDYYSGTLTEINKAAIPNNDAYKINTSQDGITLSWTGYNGKNYESSVIEWPEDLAGRHSFNLKDHVDLSANPELAGIDLRFSYNVHEKATKDDVIKAFENRTIYAHTSTHEAPEKFTSGSTTGIGFGVTIDYRTLLKTAKDFDHADDPFAEGQNFNANAIVDHSNESNWNEEIGFTFDFANIGTAHTKISNIYYEGNDEDPLSEGFWKWHEYRGDPHYTKDIFQFPMTPNNGSLNSIINALEGAGGKNLINDSSKGGIIFFNFDIMADNAFTSQDSKTVSKLGSIVMSIKVYDNDTKDDIIHRMQNITGLDIEGPNIRSTYYGSSSVADSTNKLSIEKTRTHYVYEDQVRVDIQSDFENQIIIKYDCLDTNVLGLKDTNVKTADDALKAIKEIEDAMQIVSSQRSDFGAYQNRLQHSYDINRNIVENTQAAESQIRDTDMSAEMVQYSNNNIIAQAGTAMLSQANQSQQNILSLLQ